DHVADIGDDHAHTFNRIANLSRHDEPIFRSRRVEVSLVVDIERRKILLVAIDEIRCAAVVVHDREGTFALARVQIVSQLVEGHMRNVAAAVYAWLPCEADRNPTET